MGVYIKDIEMPKSCTKCFYVEWCDACKSLGIPETRRKNMIYEVGSRAKECPLIEIELKNNR